MFSDGHLAKQRERTKRKRARRRAGVRVYHIELHDRTVEAVISALVAEQRLTAAEAAALGQSQIEHILAQLLAEQGAEWV
jgi:hypothetical protein